VAVNRKFDLGLRTALCNRCRWLVAGRWGLSRVISHFPEICPYSNLGSWLHKLGMMLTIPTAIERVIIYN